MLTNRKPSKAILLSLIAFLSFLGCDKMENETSSSLIMIDSPSQSLVNSDVAAMSGVTTSTTGFPMIDLFTWVQPQARCAYGVNNLGNVVGQNLCYGGEQHAFLWFRQYGLRDLGTFDKQSPWSMANDINDRGQVVGSSVLASTVAQRAFFWSDNGGMVNLGTLDISPDPKDDFSNAFGINNRGEIVGVAYGGPFLWTERSGMVLLSPQFDGAAWDINDNGRIVGVSSMLWPSEQYHAALWTDVGEMLDLGTLRLNSQALGINYLGEVVGGSSDLFVGCNTRIGSGFYDIVFDNGCVAFIWTKQHGMTQLPMLGGGTGCAHAINDKGQIVGWSYTGSEVHAVVWTRKDGIKDLGKLLTDDLESVAYGINNLGQVVGYSSRKSVDGTRVIRHAVIWTVK
jgi:probable HAF family extracellular repeat protein